MKEGYEISGCRQHRFGFFKPLSKRDPWQGLEHDHPGVLVEAQTCGRRESGWQTDVPPMKSLDFRWSDQFEVHECAFTPHLDHGSATRSIRPETRLHSIIRHPEIVQEPARSARVERRRQARQGGVVRDAPDTDLDSTVSLDDGGAVGDIARTGDDLVLAVERTGASGSVPYDDALPRPPRDLRGNGLLYGYSRFGEDRG